MKLKNLYQAILQSEINLEDFNKEITESIMLTSKEIVSQTKVLKENKR